MKKVICLLISLILCVSMVLPALAAENEFVPSIEYKGWPLVVTAFLDGEPEGGRTKVDDCVVVTNIAQAKDQSTDISQEDRDLLLDVYDQLKNGTMELPVEGGYVIRELVDVSFEDEDCRQIEEHGNKPEKLKEEDVTLTVTFDLDVGPYEDMIVLAYIDGVWTPIKSVKNNGDGTITCVFDDVCPVAFVAKENGGAGNPTTGDMVGNQLALFAGMMILSAAGIVILLATKARKAH